MSEGLKKKLRKKLGKLSWVILYKPVYKTSSAVYNHMIVTHLTYMCACIIPRELCVPIKHMHEQLTALFSYFLNGPRNEADTMLAHSSKYNGCNVHSILQPVRQTNTMADRQRKLAAFPGSAINKISLVQYNKAGEGLV